MEARRLRTYERDHPYSNEFLDRQTQDALDQSHSKLIAFTYSGTKLIDVINDENNRGYVVVQTVESLFRIIDRGFQIERTLSN